MKSAVKEINQYLLISFIPEKLIYSVAAALILMVVISGINFRVNAFEPAIRNFIEEGRNIRLKVREGVEVIEITPAHNIEVKMLKDSPGKGVFSKFYLNKDRKYYIKTGSAPVKYWLLQVFASRDKNQAQKVLQEIKEEGYNSVQLKKENEWFKVMVGPFTAETEAQNSASDFKEKGRDVWIRDYKEENISAKDAGSLNIYRSNGELLFSGKGMYFQGKIRFDGSIYRGQWEFILLNNKIDVFHSADMETAISALLVLQYDRSYRTEEKALGQDVKDIKLGSNLLVDASDKNNLTLLKAQAVVNRTFLMKYLVTGDKGFMRLTAYPQNEDITDVIEEAVSATSGQLLQKNGIFPDLKVDGQIVNEIYRRERQVEYREILRYIYEDTDVVNFSEKVEQRRILDTPVKKGLQYREIKQLTWWGPRSITILDLDLNESGLKVETFLSQNKISGLQNLDEVVYEKKALAAINGGYFSSNGRPLGLLIIDGEIVSEPIKNRTAVGITSDRKLLIDQMKWQGVLINNELNKRINITGVNRVPGENEAVIFNHYFGENASSLKPGIKEIVIAEGEIRQINEIARGKNRDNSIAAPIPEGGFVIQLHGNSRNQIQDFSTGDEIIYKNEFTPDWERKGVEFALGAGPTLIKEGRIDITGAQEEFQNDILQGRAPRSAVGITPDNHLLMITVDGRQPQLSIGISLTELAQFMKELGVTAAMNLDGGASTRMVVRKFIMNNPSSERLVANGLLIKIAGNH